MKYIQHISLILLLTAVVACTKTSTTPVLDDPDQNEEPTPSKLELIAKNWSIDTAYHKGVYDASSTGKQIEFYVNGRYNFDGSLQGDWYFTLDSSKLIIDEGLSYEQEWTIEDLTEKRFDVTFRSPFTNGSSRWIMYTE